MQKVAAFKIKGIYTGQGSSGSFKNRTGRKTNKNPERN